MNSRERVEAVLNGRKPDRIPNFNILMGFAATQFGKTYREYASDYRVLCDCDIACSEKYGIDMVSAISDPMREAEGFGASVTMPEDNVPYSPTPFVEDLSAAPKLVKTYNPYNGKRCEDRLKAIAYFRQNAGDYTVGGWVEGALAECCDLRGINDMLTDLATEDRELIHEFLSITCEQAKIFAIEQVKAGADIIGIGDAASSLISARMFKEFAFPYQKAIVDAVHAVGGKTKLHICGNTTRVLDQAIATGTDILDVDWMVDLERCRDLVGEGKTILCGNYDPVSILMQGTPETVRASVNACCDLFKDRYISSAGCEVPRLTPPENLLAVTDALVARA